jgi:hypothetical protein
MGALDISIAVLVGNEARSYGPIVVNEIISELGIQMVDENSIDLIIE